jgi:hypothetical protein
MRIPSGLNFKNYLRMKKTAFIIAAGLLLSSTSFAQLSQRVNDAETFKLGNRPTSGDFALTFAMPITSGGVADLSIKNTLSSGDFITGKYYLSSDLAIRGAIKLFKQSEKVKGDLVVPGTGNADGSREIKDSYREYTLAPGIEKHFSASNIFDVYTGGDLLIGLGRDVMINNSEDATGDYSNNKTTSSHLILGLGTVIGVSVYVAQLPVSVGIEYGINFKYTNEGKTHIESETSAGGTVTTMDYYTSDLITGDFSKVSNSRVGINTNNNVRIVLNIYFGK